LVLVAVVLKWATVLLCRGGAGVRGFSRPTCEGLLLNSISGHPGATLPPQVELFLTHALSARKGEGRGGWLVGCVLASFYVHPAVGSW